MSLKAVNLSHIYGAGTIYAKEALKNVSFELYSGEIVGLVGATGSGKSTLLQVLCGLLSPGSGEVFLDDVSLYSGSLSADIRQRLGISFQTPEHAFFEENVAAELAFGLKKQGLDNTEIERRSFDALQLVVLDAAVMAASPFELSGGQMRRLGIAITLALEPRVLLLDEPLAGLDPRGRKDIIAAIKAYKDKHNAAVLMVSHSMAEITQIAKRICVLHEGVLVADSSVAELFAAVDRLNEYGLELPDSIPFLRMLQDRGIELNVANPYDKEEVFLSLQDYLLNRNEGNER